MKKLLPQRCVSMSTEGVGLGRRALRRRALLDFDFDLVSIGSGPAGQRAAVQAAKLGYRAAVVERRPAASSRCSSIARTADCWRCTASAPARPSSCTSARPTFAECYKVAALDAYNKLRA